MLKCVCRLQQQKQNPQSSAARDGIEKGPNETMSERTRESPRRWGETRKWAPRAAVVKQGSGRPAPLW